MLVAIADRLMRAEIAWLIAGSTGRRLLGAADRPRDIDLEVDGDVVERAASLLGLAGGIDSAEGWSSWRAVGSLAGVAVDLSADVTVSGPGGVLGPDFAAQLGASRAVVVAGRTIHVAPPEEMLARALVAGDTVREAKLDHVPRGDYLASRMRAARASA